MTQLCIYMCVFFLTCFSIRFIPGDCIQHPMLYLRTLLFIHGIYHNLSILTPSSQSILLPSHPSLGNHWSVLFVSLSLLSREVHWCHILDFTYKWYHMVFVFLFLTPLIIITSRSIHVAANVLLDSLYSWVVFHCVYIPHFLYPFICWSSFRLLSWPSYCE